jgi:hypothetical protein
MLLTTLPCPIRVFDIDDFGVCAQSYLPRIRPAFYDLDWDWYVVRQRQITLLQQKLPATLLSGFEPSMWRAFYLGQLDPSLIDGLVNLLGAADRTSYATIQPTRRRSIAEFVLERTSAGWQSERIPAAGFSQRAALIEQANQQDYRHATRVFTELNARWVDDEFYQILHGIAGLLAQKHATPLHRLHVAVHFTQVVTNTTNIGTNSPEGIHQDGMDYIVSALVVERTNVQGGKSIVFGCDRATPLFETVLKPGQGLFQADKNTELWHVVEPIHLIDLAGPLAVRSTIGYDFTILT